MWNLTSFNFLKLRYLWLLSDFSGSSFPQLPSAAECTSTSKSLAIFSIVLGSARSVLIAFGGRASFIFFICLGSQEDTVTLSWLWLEVTRSSFQSSVRPSKSNVGILAWDLEQWIFSTNWRRVIVSNSVWYREDEVSLAEQLCRASHRIASVFPLHKWETKVPDHLC